MEKFHRIHKALFGHFRRRRMRQFLSKVQLAADDTILDVGGAWYTWREITAPHGHITLLNQLTYDLNDSICKRYDLSYQFGDARQLEFADGQFSISYSNSVIEHVGNWSDQRQFANEIRRVSRKIWVQTPAREFFVEPHYMTPFVHWLPKKVQKRILRWASVWGWVQKPDAAYIDRMVEEIRLLTRQEFSDLFPDCEILEEKLLGVFTKSYTAVRVDHELVTSTGDVKAVEQTVSSRPPVRSNSVVSALWPRYGLWYEPPHAHHQPRKHGYPRNAATVRYV